ncbi:unnamed protein product [Staurois parvus]|uniref:Protein CCSMST1 n=1 Tax=Staurois parvus TaxID=386267 RepID=A0ABN9ASM3_9NEOB|nr:unnamed protein product [Staurois parvus]
MKWPLCRIQPGRLHRSFVAACSARMVHLKKPPDSTEENSSIPIKFSTSKAGPHKWTVDRSFGSDYQQPWWKVLPVSLFITAVLIWAVFRKEAEIDENIYKPIAELLGDIEKTESQDQKGK